MKYPPKEVTDIIKLIPKEHHKNIKKILKIAYENGASDVLAIVGSLSEIPVNDVQSYGVYHDSGLDGG